MLARLTPVSEETTADNTLSVLDEAAVLRRLDDALRPVQQTLQPLAASFAARGHKLYLVGGSVRDALLDRLGHDLDFTTDARPDAILAALGTLTDSIWDTGIAYGTVSGEHDHNQLEITTFRSDTYDGNSRNPEVQFGDTLSGDLIRRDFRINAMACEVHADGSYTFHDPLGGLEDLAAGLIDTPDSPEISFGDDPLRMLRGARFVSQLDMDLSDRVATAMTAMAGEITRISVERIAHELDRLMLGLNPVKGVDVMVSTGLCDYFFPEIPALQLTPDEHMRHKDVYRHSLQVLQQAIDQEEDGPDLVLRWAALIHDIGKPDTRAAKPGGGVTFYQHESVGAKLARRRFRALKYSKRMISDINDLVFLHMRFHGYGESEWTDSAVRRYVADAGDLLPKLHKLVRADVTTRNQRKAARLARAYDNLEQRIAELQEQESLAQVRPALDGNAIMKLLDLRPGPEVGQAWAFLKELRLEEGPMEPEEATARLLQWWEQRQQ
ncbi:CCA tRNA nucleotidyltransferase [Corynebacterium choanae]